MITLYDFAPSGNSYRARLFLSLLGLGYEKSLIDLGAGQHKEAAYLKLNPLGQVPTLVDDGEVIRDSCAILIYLSSKYDNTGNWSGKTAEEKAHIQEWLSTATREMMFGPARARAIKLFGRPFDLQEAQALAHQLFTDVMEPHLQQNQWLAASRPTIADIASYAYVTVSDEGEVFLDNYPNIRRWLKDVEALPGFVPMVRAGS